MRQTFRGINADIFLRMDQFHPFLWFLVSIGAVTLAAHVEPPTNVTLDCHNLRNTLKWSYDQPFQGLRYKVDFGSDHDEPVVLWVDPPALQVDVPIHSDPTYSYLLAVTAVNGQNESEAAPPEGITFSYFSDAQVTLTCSVDFPPVNITFEPDGRLLFRFTHPWLVYQKWLPSGRKELPIFNYDIVVFHEDKREHDFICMESVCEERLPVDPELKKHCLMMTGELDKISVGKREFCIMPPTSPREQSNNLYIGIGVVMLILIAIAVVTFMVYKKITKPPTSLPNPLNNVKERMRQWTFSPVPDPVVMSEVEPTSPLPLLTNDGYEATPTATPSTEIDVRLRIGVTEDEGVCDVDVKNDDGEEPGYMRGRNMEGDESPPPSERSGYEKRPVLVELGPDEQAEGYRG